MPKCFFVSDLHGSPEKFYRLFEAIEGEQPSAVFLGGDLLPHARSCVSSMNLEHRDFINDFLVGHLLRLREKTPRFYPRIFLILGNDDARFEEAAIMDAAAKEVWEYISERKVSYGSYVVFGYPFTPPSPFQLKDWERYDISRYVDPRSVSPEEGLRTKPVSDYQKKFTTIRQDLAELVNDDDLDRAIMLFHAPPYKTNLDRADLDGKSIDHVLLDVHVGSMAIRELIEDRQPMLTLHGHVHESTRLTGSWRQRIGRTLSFNAAHEGPELALIRFDPDHPEDAVRYLLF